MFSRAIERRSNDRNYTHCDDKMLWRWLRYTLAAGPETFGNVEAIN